MKAMILAAGLGTRLRPLTEDRPKALVEVDGRTLLEITLSRLRNIGVHEVIINVHHFADAIVEYLKRNDNFNMRVEVSREESLLDTGGGLKKAAAFFLEEDNASDTPFFVHNVDVISTLDLGLMLEFHRKSRSLATLAIQDRETSRYLLFDEQLRLCGRQSGRDGDPQFARSSLHVQPLAFCGIHVVSPRIFRMINEEGCFSIIDTYLDLAGRGEPILGFQADEYYWRDVGSLDSLRQAGEDLARRTPL
jgi:NDP-sugar pyrophosphorylase family protein